MQSLESESCEKEVGGAPACEISGLKDARTRLQTVHFQFYNTSTFNAAHFDKNPFTGQGENESKKAEGFQMLHCYRSFSMTS